MFQMLHFLLSTSVGKQRVFEPSYSKEKLRIQNIVDTLCHRLCECKVILQEIILSLTPDRSHKEMTQALAERAVEVTCNISHLLEGAEETPQLLDNILQLEQILRDIYGFVQSDTQQNLLFRILFATDLPVRYFSLDKQLRGLLKAFEHSTVKKCDGSLSTTVQEGHPGVASQQDGTLAEIVPLNNSSAHRDHASGSFFHNANNIVVQDGAFYAAHNLVVKKVQDYDRTPQGIVEGADVFTPGDVVPKKEIYKGRGYRVYSAHSTAKGRAVKIKLYEGSCAKDRCLAAANFSQKVMHPNVLHLIGVSPLNSELPFLVFDESTEWAIESIIASALNKGLKQSLFLGLQTVAGLSSGLDYLHTLLYPFASVGLDHFVVSSSHGNIVISFDPEVLADETRERDQPSGASDGGNESDIFHGLCQKTFDAACKAHYEFQKVQRSDFDELDAYHDLDQDRFEEIEVDAGTLLEDTKGSISDASSSGPSAPQLHNALPDASSMSSISSQRPFRKSRPSARRRELVWRSQKNETDSLEEIARQFQSSLLTFSTELGFNHRRGRYTTKTAHRCPGYNRIEITLTPDIARSAVVSHLTPIPHEICPVCKEIVKDAEIFACICGRDDNESVPTIRCSTCSEWHHRPCVSISENEDQSFVCQRCKDMRNKVLGKEHSESVKCTSTIIFVIGSTWTGKSTFINTAISEDVMIVNRLLSYPSIAEVKSTSHWKISGRSVIFVEIPAAFIHSDRQMQMVITWLTENTHPGMPVNSGIIFLHSMSLQSPRMIERFKEYLDPFVNLCHACGYKPTSVLLVLTQWHEDESEIEMRKKTLELEEYFQKAASSAIHSIPNSVRFDGRHDQVSACKAVDLLMLDMMHQDS